MERKGKSYHHILILWAISVLSACTDASDMGSLQEGMTTVHISCPGYETRAVIPDEERIHDLNLLFFADGELEEALWQTDIPDGRDLSFDVRLAEGRTYSVCAIANFGKQLTIRHQEEVHKIRYELADCNGYGNGIPMSAMIEGTKVVTGRTIRMELVRMAAKISIRIDRCRLSDGVRMEVRKARIGNYPRTVSLAGPSRAASEADVFGSGFELTQEQCSALNRDEDGRSSGEASLYMLENMQGKSQGTAEDSQSGTASFIELEIDYETPELISYDSPLIYRFHIGETSESLDIERNCHYHITVIPEDDGLSGSGWKVDKSGIGPSTPVFRMQPGEYLEGKVGDTLRVWCECYPKTAPFDPGIEELEYDRRRGIYDYTIDDDRHGVTLYLKRPGSGIVYMTAGDPINRSGMVLVCVNP